ncbi:MAG: hypothetical protein BroJett021_43800 [Chloroflexota bacterium]|nr:MAG: hypothetical protein BroJett021_43800 [Chloroflexota bacterium]
MWFALQDDILNAEPLAQFAFGRCIAVFIHDEYIRHEFAQFWLEVEIARAAGDDGLLHAGHIGEHEASLFLTIDRRPALKLEYSAVRAKRHC